MENNIVNVETVKVIEQPIKEVYEDRTKDPNWKKKSIDIVAYRKMYREKRKLNGLINNKEKKKKTEDMKDYKKNYVANNKNIAYRRVKCDICNCEYMKAGEGMHKKSNKHKLALELLNKNNQLNEYSKQIEELKSKINQ